MHQSPLFDGDGDIGALARFVRLDQRNMPALASHVAQRDGMVEHSRGEVALILEELPDAFFVLFQFGRVIGLVKQVFQKKSVRNSDGMKILHRTDHLFIAKVFIALNDDLANFDLRAFIYVEGDLERRRRHLADFGVHRGKLPAALRQVFLQHHRGSLHLVGIVLRFDRQPYLPLLEPVEHLRHRDRLHTRAVLDGSDHAAFGYDKAHQQPRLGWLRLQPDVIEAAGIP